MNMPVVQNQQVPQLPAHLQRHMTQVSAVSADVMSGLSSGAIHKISIEGRRWKLQDPQGQEFMVPTFHLDVILVGANPHVSKTFYATKWNQQVEGKAPDCWSDNGVGPSSRATAPQCTTCQACPNNAWGSRISETGSQVKACADSKKIAVILAENPTGPVYQLKVPADSLKNMAHMAKAVATRKVPLDRVVMRLEFDPAVSHPKIVFSSPDYVNVQQDAAVDEVLGSEEITEALNLTDVAIKSMPAQIAQQPAMAQAPMAVPQMQPQPVPQMPQAPYIPQMAPVVPQQPVAPVYNPMVASASVAPVVQQPVASEAPPPVKRRRKAAAPAEAAQQQVYQAQPGMPASAAPQPIAPQLVVAPQAVPQMPPIPAHMVHTQDVPNAQPPAASVPLTPTPTDAALDGLLGNAMVR